jgi:hypothetical protein
MLSTAIAAFVFSMASLSLGGEKMPEFGRSVSIEKTLLPELSTAKLGGKGVLVLFFHAASTND